MKVLLITTTYPTPARPRQGAFNHVLVQALRTRHEVRVIAPIPWTQSLRQKVGGSKSARTLHPRYYYPPKILREHYHRFYWWSIRPSIELLEKEFSPDIVVGYWLHPDGAAAVRAARRFGVPSIVMAGGTDLRLLPGTRRRRVAIARVLENADRLIVFSRELAAQSRHMGLQPDEVDVVYRGVNRDCFYRTDRAAARTVCGVPNSSVMILWAGRFEPVKNPALLLYAATHWKRRWSDRLRVIVAGDGPLRKQLHRLRQQLGLQDVVLFAGNLTQSELAQHFSAADLTVLTSHSEGTPNVLLESIACGTPFVSTDVGGVAEIATSGIDRLVPPGDANALANAVIQHMRVVPTGHRVFFPTDLAGMADQLDTVIKRAVGDIQAPVSKSTYGHRPMPLSTAIQPSFQEPARR